MLLLHPVPTSADAGPIYIYTYIRNMKPYDGQAAPKNFNGIFLYCT